jgi:hypothetical protein
VDQLSGTMKAKIDAMTALSGLSLTKMFDSKKAFCVCLGPGDSVAIPPGYLVLHFAKSNVEGVRWGFLSKNVEHRRAAATTVHDFLDAFPAARTSDMCSWELYMTNLTAPLAAIPGSAS